MYLTEKTKRILEKTIGKSISDITKMSFDEEKKYVEEKIKRPLVFSKERNPKITGRGSPLIVRHRICTMNDIDKKIKELK